MNAPALEDGDINIFDFGGQARARTEFRAAEARKRIGTEECGRRHSETRVSQGRNQACRDRQAERY